MQKNNYLTNWQKYKSSKYKSIQNYKVEFVLQNIVWPQKLFVFEFLLNNDVNSLKYYNFLLCIDCRDMCESGKIQPWTFCVRQQIFALNKIEPRKYSIIYIRNSFSALQMCRLLVITIFKMFKIICILVFLIAQPLNMTFAILAWPDFI